MRGEISPLFIYIIPYTMAKKKTFAEVVEGLELSAENKQALLDAKQKEDETLTAELKKSYDESTQSLTAELKAGNAAEIEKLTAELKAENADEIEALKAEIDSLKSNASIKERKTPGSFTAKNKKEYKFVDGVLKFNHKGNIIQTVDALEDKALMEELIGLGAGIIEEVN